MQGLKEADRFDVLCSVVNGNIKADMPSVRVEARRRKNLMSVRREFQLVAKKRTWEECVEAFPMHTTVDALQPFMGKILIAVCSCQRICKSQKICMGLDRRNLAGKSRHR